MNGAPKEIKVKINESQLLKFYKENSTERKFNREFYGKLEKTQIQRTLKLFDKTKIDKKYSNSKNFVSRTLSQISFLQIVLKLATLYLFYSFLSYFICIKFLLKTVLSVLSFRINIRTVELTI